jgi:hypothetical protein
MMPLRGGRRPVAPRPDLIEAWDQVHTAEEMEQEFGAGADEQDEDDAHAQSEREEAEAAGRLAALDRDLLRLLAEHHAVVREYAKRPKSGFNRRIRLGLA